MTAPATEDLRELERLLSIAFDTGEPAAVETLRDELGLGHDDLAAALSTLSAHWKAEEVAPGLWSAPDPEEVRQALQGHERVTVSLDDEERDDAAEDRMREMDGRTGAGYAPPPQPTVRLTRAIAEALDADALGKLVLAGLGDVDGVFILEVVP